MPRIIEVDCDKWKDRLWICLKILFYIGWGLLTVGLVYIEYAWLSWSLPQIKATDGALLFVLFGAILIGLANAVNLFFVSNRIYERQNLFKFKCVSGKSSSSGV